MGTSNERKEKHARNRRERYEQIKPWAEYVRTHPDKDWGEQVNTLVNSQLQSAVISKTVVRTWSNCEFTAV